MITALSEKELSKVEGGWLGAAFTNLGIGLIGFAIGGLGGVVFVAVAKAVN